MAIPNRPVIEAMRLARPLKRSELADRVGCSRKHIWGIERGTHPASEELLIRIARELGASVDQLKLDENKEAA